MAGRTRSRDGGCGVEKQKSSARDRQKAWDRVCARNPQAGDTHTRMRAKKSSAFAQRDATDRDALFTPRERRGERDERGSSKQNSPAAPGRTPLSQINLGHRGRPVRWPVRYSLPAAYLVGRVRTLSFINYRTNKRHIDQRLLLMLRCVRHNATVNRRGK